MAKDSKDLYEKVWGEPAPMSHDSVGPSFSPNGIGSTAELAVTPTLIQSSPPPAALPPPPTPLPPDSPKAVLVQQQMAETLRRLEARVADLQQRVQPYTENTFQQSIAGAHEISERLGRATTELGGLIEYAQRLVRELAKTQAEAREGLGAIGERLKELERPRRFRK